MNSWPETRSTLLRLVRDPQDQAAWERFDAHYRPVIYRFARARGLQHSDADTIVSEVMARVFRAAKRWSGPDAQASEQPQRFRAWLHRVARNALLNQVTRQIARRGTGGTSHQLALADRAIVDDAMQRLWEGEHQRQLFSAAALHVQAEVDPQHWIIFWQTHVEDVSVDEAANRHSRSVGSVYAIRSRILRRLRETVTRMESLQEVSQKEAHS
ncbi:MAG: sigma-70 family RNA polymerase sigma factor [Planctomycetota bacterium]